MKSATAAATFAVAAQAEAAGFPCPSFLQSICDLVDDATCLANCMPRLGSCITDTDCRQNMENFGACMASMPKNATADMTQACLVPDNQLRSEFIFCIMDGGESKACLTPPIPPTDYPKCADDTIVGDAKFNIDNINGLWYKVSGWTRGELVECLPCQTVEFSDYDPTHPLPWPAPKPPVNESTRIIKSTWHEQDSKNKWWPMEQTSLWGPRAGRQGFPGKDFSTGTMFGLGYDENYTVIHDGTTEKEPFMFLYACGATKQGVYTSGLVLAKDKTATPTLRARIDAVATAAGWDPKNWCDVDNTDKGCALEQNSILV